MSDTEATRLRENADYGLKVWLDGEGWTDFQRAVIVTAEALADADHALRPWWRRRRRSPMEFVDTARYVVVSLEREGLAVTDATQIDGSEASS